MPSSRSFQVLLLALPWAGLDCGCVSPWAGSRPTWVATTAAMMAAGCLPALNGTRGQRECLRVRRCVRVAATAALDVEPSRTLRIACTVRVRIRHLLEAARNHVAQRYIRTRHAATLSTRARRGAVVCCASPSLPRGACGESRVMGDGPRERSSNGEPAITTPPDIHSSHVKLSA